MDGMKRCSKCRQEKPVEAFSKNKQCKDGLHGHCKECNGAYVKAHYVKNKTLRDEQKNRWRQQHSEEHRIASKVYRTKCEAAKLGRREHFTVKEWIALCEKSGNKCLCCGADKPLTVDHIVPLSKGGVNTIDNIQPICFSCNARKNTHTMDYRSKD